VFELDHVPPVDAFVNVVVAPLHKVLVPAIDAGFALTVITKVALGVHPFEYVITVVPWDIPVTIPDTLPIVAIAVFELDHVPPPTELLNVAVPPMHNTEVPEISAGVVLTDTTNVAGEHPFSRSYDIVLFPILTPVTIPVLPTVAIEVVEDVHIPPDGEEDNDEPEPTHAIVEPVIAEGEAMMVTVVTTGVPQPFAYVIAAVPTETPVTIPEIDPTVAILVLLLVHDPTPPVFVSVLVLPLQIVVVPLVVPGREFTTNIAIAGHAPRE